MPINTCSKLGAVLKEVWTDENMKYTLWNKAYDLELADARRDMQRGMQRQIYSGTTLPGAYPSGNYIQMPIHLDMSPAAVRIRKQRQQLMLQQYAATKRKGKPSYRQRQKNARAANQSRPNQVNARVAKR